MRDSPEKGAGMRDHDPVFQTLTEQWKSTFRQEGTWPSIDKYFHFRPFTQSISNERLAVVLLSL